MVLMIVFIKKEAHVIRVLKEKISKSSTTFVESDQSNGKEIELPVSDQSNEKESELPQNEYSMDLRDRTSIKKPSKLTDYAALAEVMCSDYATPKSFAEAITSSNASDWKSAMQDELTH
jgi:hypothetical protein